MKKILRLFCVLCALMFCFNHAQAAPVSTNENVLRLTVELRDGSRVTGESLDDILHFHSASLGDMKLPVASIRSVEFSADGETAHLTATNGDAFDVQFIISVLRVETGFGKTELPVKLIRSIKVFAAGKPGQMPAGLVALWSGEGNANDSVGGNNGTLMGSTTFAPGKIGQGFEFDGNNGSGVLLGNPAGLQLQDFTIEAWIKRSSASVVSHGSGGNGNLLGCGWGGFDFFMEWNGRLDFDKFGDVYPQYGPFITDTNFHHVALTKAGGTVVFYLDGVAHPVPNYSGTFNFTSSIGIGYRPDNGDNSFMGTIDEMGVFNRALSDSEIQTIYETVQPPVLPPQKVPYSPVGKTNIQTTAASTNATDFRLTIELRDGSRITGKSLDDPWRFHSSSLGDMKLPVAGIRSVEFSASGETARLTAANGDVFDVQYIATTLYVETGFGKTELPVKLIRSIKVSSLGNSGQMPAGLVALWSGEGDGSDSVGGNNMAPTDISFVEGKVGQAFGFNGLNQSVNCGNQKAGNFGADDFTVTFWVKFNTVDTEQVMVEKYIEGLNGPEATSGWTMTKLSNNRFQFADATSRVNYGYAVADTWTHMAVTRENGIVRCYVNGVLSGQLATPADLDSTASLKLGHRGNPTDTPGSADTRQFYLNGALDEIAFYNRALSAAEIQAIGTEQNNGEPLPPPAPAPNANPFYNGFDQNGIRPQLSHPLAPLP
jgi:hypothetical protein